MVASAGVLCGLEVRRSADLNVVHAQDFP